jgi:uncharacterized membrane protein
VRRVEVWGITGLAAVTAASVIGFGTFGLHPEWLAGRPSAVRFYAVSFPLFSQLQVWAAFFVFAAVLWKHARVSWLSAFAALYAISLGSELLGTTLGIPFGAYAYDRALGPMWLARVPVIIPLSWFVMATSSFALTRITQPHASSRTTIFFASLVLLAWDLALDPAMSAATRFWKWSEAGPYYGMPLLNLLGWYITGVALMTALSAMHARRWIDRIPARFIALFYAINVLLPLGMNAAAGLWWAVVLPPFFLVALLVAWPLRTSVKRMAEVFA